MCVLLWLTPTIIYRKLYRTREEEYSQPLFWTFYYALWQCVMLIPTVFSYFKNTSGGQPKSYACLAVKVSIFSLVYQLLWNQGFFLSRVLSSDIIFNTCTIEVFIVNLLPPFAVYSNTTFGKRKLVLLLISLAGFVVIFH